MFGIFVVVGVSCVSLLLAWISSLSGSASSANAINAVLPGVVGASCAWASYHLLKSNPLRLWTPLPWFFVAWSLYYGLGPLIYHYGTAESVDYMDLLFPVDEQALLRTNVLNWIGLLAVLGGAMSLPVLPKRPVATISHRFVEDPWRVASLFLIIGLPVRYFLELPYALQLTDWVLPGSIKFIGTLSELAILPLTAAVQSRHRWAKTLLWSLALTQILVGFIMLSKLQIIRVVLLLVLGRYMIRPSIRALVATGFLIGVCYVAVLSPLVNYGRFMLGRASAENAAEAFDLLQGYGMEGRDTVADILPGVQSWWTRLCYANTQAFAMDQYDRGTPGWTFQTAVYVFLPRIIYEDKPIMTPGIEFTRLIQGTDTSSTGLGFVAEAYWNGGWQYVLGACFFVGMLFSWLGRVSCLAATARRWLFTPLMFQTIFLGLRPDDWFVPTYVGGVLQVLIFVGLLHLLMRPLVTREPSR